MSDPAHGTRRRPQGRLVHRNGLRDPEILRLDARTRAENDRALDRVSQLAQIARPAVRANRTIGALRKRELGPMLPRLGPLVNLDFLASYLVNFGVGVSGFLVSDQGPEQLQHLPGRLPLPSGSGSGGAVGC